MSDIKDTDIDDLFQRASDKYPLRTDSANWDRMADALENEPSSAIVDAEEKRKKRRFFWLFLLLPLAGAGYFALHHGGQTNPSRANVNVAATPMPSATQSVTTGTVASPNHTPSAHGKTTTPTDDLATTGGATTGGSATTDGATTNATTAKNARTTGGKTTFDATTYDATPKGTSPNGKPTAGSWTTGSPMTGSPLAGSPISTGSTGTGSPMTGSPLAGNATTTPDEDRLFYDLQRVAIPRNYSLNVNVTAPAIKKDSTKPTQKTKHFYAGLIGAPDFSTVKMQSVKGVGSTFGIVLGYTFKCGHWGIETGAYLDRKKYYTDGEYFNTKEVALPPNSWLTNVNGVCYMWEIPLNIRYNFNPGAKISWFATAGFSTYLMSSENYQYGLKWTGGTGVYDSSWNIHKPSQYPFSIINLSAGFEQRLGKIGNLRVEPYVRLPLTGLGTGKLPIMSTGVNIGITRQLW